MTEDTPREPRRMKAPGEPKVKQKRCAKCGEKKPVEDFPKHGTSSDGRASYCRPCKNGLAKDRRLNNPIARLRHYIVTRIKNEFGDATPKDVHTELEGYLGYELWELKRSLRIKVRADYGIGLVKSFKEDYHLDHIKPHSSFDIKAIGDEEFKRCWAVDNLKMIPSQLNLQKGAKAAEEVEGYKLDEEPEEDEGEAIDG